MQVVIERSKWLRGDASKTDSALLRSRDGKMCCLGFLSLACGISKDQIRDVTTPSELFGSPANIPEAMKWLVGDKNRDSDEGNTIMSVNDTYTGYASQWDDGKATNMRGIRVEGDPDRERIITETFAKHGIKVKFVD